MMEDALASPGLYLFALPTTALIDEQAEAFFAARPSLAVGKVYAKPGKPSTGRQLNDARVDFEGRGIAHGVIFTTHVTLMDTDLDAFGGWHARIDEAPAALQAGKLEIKLLRPWFSENFKLEHVPGDDWSLLLPTGKPLSFRKLEKASGGANFIEAIKQAGRGRVFLKTSAWSEKDSVYWFSMWTPAELANFKSVVIAGSGYTSSVGFKAAKHIFGQNLSLVTEDVSPPRTGQPTITIRYFSCSNDTSTTHWAEHDGLKSLCPITDWLSNHFPADGFWSGNKIIETVMMGRVHGDFIQPLAAGTNRYRDRRACAFMFSSKETPSDKPLREAFALTPDDIERSRETEAIFQFVMRGAIRNPDYDGPYEINLYSEVQANRVKDYLQSIGFRKIVMVPENVGTMSYVRARKGRPAPGQDDQVARNDRRERDAARKRASRAEAAIADGRAPGKGGRPKESSADR